MSLKQSISIAYLGRMKGCGKNRIKETFINGRKIRYPEPAFKIWRADFQRQVFSQAAARLSGSRTIFGDGKISIRADYHPADAICRDATALLDAVFHAFEARNGGCILDNDGQVKRIDWREHPIDRENPRLEMTLKQT